MRLLFLQLNNIILGKTFYFLKWATQNSMLQAQTNQKRIIIGFRLQEQTDTYNIYLKMIGYIRGISDQFNVYKN